VRVGSAQQPNEILSSHTSLRSAAAFFPPRTARSARALRGKGRGLPFLLAFATGGVAVWGAWTGMQGVERGPEPAEAKLVSASVIRSRAQKLDEFELQLQAALAKKPPALPKVPKFPPVKIPKVAPLRGSAVPVQVVYVESKDDEYKDEHKDEHKDGHKDEHKDEPPDHHDDKVDGEHH
jgi:hypothetical protein